MARSVDIHNEVNGLSNQLEAENHQLQNLFGQEAQLKQKITILQNTINKKITAARQAEVNETKDAEKQRIQANEAIQRSGLTV